MKSLLMRLFAPRPIVIDESLVTVLRPGDKALIKLNNKLSTEQREQLRSLLKSGKNFSDVSFFLFESDVVIDVPLKAYEGHVPPKPIPEPAQEVSSISPPLTEREQSLLAEADRQAEKRILALVDSLQRSGKI